MKKNIGLTIQEWQKEFPFWSVDTVKRTLTKLRKLDILTTGNFNKMKRDRTLWYTINYDELEKLDQESEKIEEDNSENMSADNLEQEEDSTTEEMKVKKDKEIEKEERQLELLKLPISARCPNGENIKSADCPNGKVQDALAITRDFYRDFYRDL